MYKKCGMMVALLVLFASWAWGEEVTYRKHIRPIMEAHCYVCHGSDAAPELGDYEADKKKWESQGKGMRMDTYSHLLLFVGWPDTGAIMRRLDDGKGQRGGKPGNMYQNLGSTEEERQKNLSLFKAWVGNWTLSRWKDVTKEDLNRIKAKY